MRKILSIFFVLLIAGCLFATNTQKIYPVDSDVYETIKSLYIATGRSLPSTTGPWSASELLLMVDKISENEVPAYLKASYDSVLSELAEEPEHQWKGIGASFSNELNLQLGFHTNTDSPYTRTTLYRNEKDDDLETWTEQLFIGRDNWSSNYLHEIEPMYRLNWETWVSDIAYSYFEFGLFNSYHGNSDNDYGVKSLSTNIFMFQNLSFEPAFMDANFPYRAFISAGGANWSIQIGRDRLSWGAGKTGNLTMSNNFLYHDMARITAFSDKYKYTFLTSFYPHPVNYYWYDENNTPNHMNYTTGQDGLDGVSMYMAHRVEGRFANDKLGLVLTEAIMYESKDNRLDLSVINPVFIFHNQYNPDVANSTLCIEADLTPINGLNIYGQMIIDEFAIPLIEESASADNNDTPNRYGYLAGVTYITGFGEGVISANVEYAQIDPYTYLRANKKSGETDSYGLDYVVATRMWSTAIPDVSYDDKFLGYTYGPDCKVLNLNIDYATDKLDVSVNFLSMMHGTHDQWTKVDDVGGHGEEDWKQCDTTCTTKHEFGSWRFSDAQVAARNAVIKLMDIGVSASYKLLDCLKIYGQFDYVSIKNAYNIEGQDDSDIQIVAGLKYSF